MLKLKMTIEFIPGNTVTGQSRELTCNVLFSEELYKMCCQSFTPVFVNVINSVLICCANWSGNLVTYDPNVLTAVVFVFFSVCCSSDIFVETFST